VKEDKQIDHEPLEEEQESAEPTKDDANAGAEDPTSSKEEQLTMEERLEQLEAEAAEYLDGWQRARAEFVNFKKRVERERAESRARIAAELLTRYLDVLDDLDRTISEMPEEIAETPWSHGLQMVYQKMQLLLESEGVKTIDAVGESFDPNFHEAISFEDSEDHDEGQVVDVIQKGYMLGERVLRPAMVRVAK
jgi:molecular chaperone GrpE